MKRIKFFLIMGSIVFTLCSSVHAEDRATLRLDRDSVSPGKQVVLTLIIPGKSAAANPALPFMNGLNIRHQRNEAGRVVLDGREADAVFCVYKVAATREGEYAIGPLTFELDGRRYITNGVLLKVSKEFANVIPRGPSSPDTRADLSKHITLSVDLPKNKILVNQPVPITIKLKSDWFDLEDITMPIVKTKEVIIKKFEKGATNIVVENNTRYALLEYNSSLVVPFPGVFTIEPFKCSFNIARRRALPSGGMPELLNDNEVFYDALIGDNDKLPYELSTEAAEIEAVGLPKEGRPDTFRGAVGKFDFDMKISSTQLKEGDVVKLELAVTGKGNFNTVTTIDIPKMDGFRYFEPRITRSDSKFVMEQGMRLVSYGSKEVPVVTFTYFEPDSGTYRSINRGPIPLAIAPFGRADGRQMASEKVPSKAIVSKPAEGELIGMKRSPGAFRTIPALPGLDAGSVGLILLPVILLIAETAVKKRRDYLADHRDYANWLRGNKLVARRLAHVKRLAAAGSQHDFYGSLFDLLREYLGIRLMLPPGGISESTIRDLLVEKIDDGVPVGAIENIFFDCHYARFTNSKVDRDDMMKSFNDAESLFRDLNKRISLYK